MERVGIGLYPTPFEGMPRLEAELDGPRLFVKREDLTGVALGGNKVRQLDYLLVEAQRRHCDYVITTCGIQSNWSRQTVALANRMGMRTLLVLRTAQFGRTPRVFEGNLLLDQIMGAKVKIIKMRINEDPQDILESEADRLRKKGHNPLILGLAEGVSPLATVAYVDAAIEIVKQAGDVNLDAIIVATSAGATQAGLTLGVKMLGLGTRVIGVNVGAFKKKVMVENILNSSNEAAKILGSSIRLNPEDVVITDKYAGTDYGIPTRQSIRAIETLARTEALILDPVYTSKAMAGLIDMVRSKEFRKDQNVCFVHTGGVPALFAYGKHFQPNT